MYFNTTCFDPSTVTIFKMKSKMPFSAMEKDRDLYFYAIKTYPKRTCPTFHGQKKMPLRSQGS